VALKGSEMLKVTSHVGRDILASAANFKTEASVVWEYVANSLQYVESGLPAKVQVLVKSRDRSIEIRDNGRGMDAQDLQHFFTMHGENLERRIGRPGRGKFGTGKSAAFGIAKCLRIDTRKNGIRNVTELRREMIDSSTGGSVPIRVLVRDEAIQGPNGTTVQIGDVVLDRINTTSIIEYIERHLSAFRYLNPEVAVNGHPCIPKEISVTETKTFIPSVPHLEKLGKIQLIVNVSQVPLGDEDQGIHITAGVGNLVAIERAGLERKEFGNYLFGEVDVPALETFESPIEPYDSTRSLQLNSKHPIAAVLLSFIGAKLEEVRQELVRRTREARKTEEARRLSAEAQRIAEIINRDFSDVRKRLQSIRSAVARPGELEATFGDKLNSGVDEDAWIVGGDEPGRIAKSTNGSEGKGGAGRPAPNVTARGERDDTGDASVDPAGGAGSKPRAPRGAFGVAYRSLGKNEGRSKYDANTLTILINLDHVVVTAALGDGKVEDLTFRRLSYEIAFSEYAMALGYEICKQDPNIPADDILYEVRTSLNRISAAAASLYR
jgi:hypothetical protein